MATRSSLGTVSTPATLAVSNGTLQIEGNTVTAINLSANTTLKTNSERHIISANLVKADIKDLGDILTNPLTTDLDANGKNIENVGNIETTLVNSRGILYNTSIANLNMGGFNINNSPTITTLQGKTAFITTNPEYNETVFNGPVLLNGTVSNANEILFVNGSSITTNTQDLTLYSPFNISTDSNINSTVQITCNTLNATNISVPAITTLQTKTQNLTASIGQATFSGILNVNSDLKANGLSTLVGGILSNQKISLTKNIIEIQEDGVYTEAITIGNLATTGYSLPRTNGSIAGQELRLQSNNKLGWYSPSTYIRFNRNTTLGSVTLLTSPINTRLSIFPLLINESSSPFSVFNTTASGAQYISTEPRKAFQISYNTMAKIATNPAGGEAVIRLIHRKAGPVEAVLSAFRFVMSKDVQYPISLQAVGFDIVQNDVLDVSIENSVASTIQLDSQQVSIIAN